MRRYLRTTLIVGLVLAAVAAIAWSSMVASSAAIHCVTISGYGEVFLRSD